MCTWRDKAYYIYDGTATSLSFTDVWAVEKRKHKASQERKQKGKRKRTEEDDEVADEFEQLHAQVQRIASGGDEDEDDANLRRLLQSSM